MMPSKATMVNRDSFLGSLMPQSPDCMDYKSLKARDDNERPYSFSMLWRKGRTWAFPALISFLLVLLTWPATNTSAASSVASRADLTDPPRKSTGLTDAVQWDNFTLFVNQQRIFL